MKEQALTAAFAALADPTRRAILSRLALGEANVTELVRPFKLSQPAVSRHLKVLEEAGLITRGRAAQSRPCRLAPEPLKQMADWLDGYREFWDHSFGRLDEYLDELQQQENRDALQTAKRR